MCCFCPRLEMKVLLHIEQLSALLSAWVVICCLRLDALEKAFDLILANINRNVLLEHIPIYHEMTAERGRWILSGFYAHDAEPIRRQAAKYGWQAGRSVEQDGWVAQEFQRA